MAHAICRCGNPLILPSDGSERIVCSKCGARVRIKRKTEQIVEGSDGYIRFHCPCGRRLKVDSRDKPTHGKCPDCGRVVPIPDQSKRVGTGTDDRQGTADMTPEQIATLTTWTNKSGADPSKVAVSAVPATFPESDPPSTVTGYHVPPKVEAGLRVCPRCGKPLHLAATVCRECGAPTPKKES